MQEVIEESKKETRKKVSGQGISLKAFFSSCLRYWYWFLISVLVFGTLAFLYSKSQKQIYSSSAYILVLDERNGTKGSQSQVFSDLNLGRVTNDVPNEIFKIRSSVLMEEVVKQLGLNIQYYGHLYLRDVNVYKNTPLQITPFQDITTPFTMNVVPKGDDDLEFMIEGDGGWKKAHFGNKVNTRFGPIAINKTAKYNNSYKNYQVKINVTTPKAMAKALVSKLQAESADRYSDVIKLSLTCDNEVMCADVLNALVAVYNQDAINDKNRVARNTELFIADRIVSLSKDLSGVDSRVAQLKINSINATIYSDPGNSIRYADNASDVGIQLSLANEIRNYLASMTGNELIPSNTGISNTGIEGQISQYNEVMLQYQNLIATSSSENPAVVDRSRQLAAMKSNIMQSINNYISSLRVRQNQARSQEGLATSSMVAVPSQEKAITEVTRQQKIKEQLYLYLLNKREENALQLAITEPNAKVIEQASNGIQIAPMPSKIMTLGILLGLLIPAGIIFLIFWLRSLDTLVHNRRDVESACDIPIIGEVPEKKQNQKDKEIIVTETGTDRITEALRILRSNIDFMTQEKEEDKGLVMQLTSTTAGEGKSFIAINFALSCAHAEKRVIAIDMDLRKGRFTEYVNMHDNGVGLSAYLSGQVTDIDSIITPSNLHENLDLITVGALPPNPTNLLMSKRLKHLINELKQRYDYIILDTVPFGVIADATLINRYADITMYVIRDGKVDKRYLADLEKLSEEGKLKNLTILLNDVKMRDKRYGYGYGYGYGYNSDYYGDDEKPSFFKKLLTKIRGKKHKD